MEQYIQPQSRFKVILGDPVLLSCSGKPLKYLTFGNYPGTLKDLKYPWQFQKILMNPGINMDMFMSFIPGDWQRLNLIIGNS